MRRRTVLFSLGASAVLASAGCGDRLKAGYQGVLVCPPGATKVSVEAISEHRCPDSGRRAYVEAAREKCTEELVPAGSKVSVVQDDPAKEGPDRPIKIKLLEEPLAGVTGTVKRSEIE